MLSKKIKQIRLERGETLEEFGNHFDATKANVWQWENGKSNPNKKRIKKIANMANVTVTELLSEESEETDLTKEEKELIKAHRLGATIQIYHFDVTTYEEAMILMKGFEINRITEATDTVVVGTDYTPGGINKTVFLDK